MTNALDDVRAALLRFSEVEAKGSSPLYERLARAASEDNELSALLLSAPITQRRPTLFFAAIYYLVLADPSCALGERYREGATAPELVPVFTDFCLNHADELRELLATRSTQTNEVRRSAAWLPVLGNIAASAPSELGIIEIGTSAGLTLLVDRFAYDYGTAGRVGDARSPVIIAPVLRGDEEPPLPTAMPHIRDRIGIDLAPIDVRDEDAVRWLRACIWPEHHDRLALLEGAVSIARSHPPTVIEGDAFDLLPSALEAMPDPITPCLINSTTLPYLEPEKRAGLCELVAEQSRARDLYWISFEGYTVLPFELDVPAPPIVDPGPVMSCTVARATGGRIVDGRTVAYAGPHGEWLRWL